jgi:predicted nucleotidyltransferase
VRATDDVDVIVEVASYAEYARFSKRLRNLGFSEDSSEGAPICRWLIDRMKLDVMPTDETILGFSNRWYKPAIETAAIVALDGFELRVVTTPYFIGTKLEAFRGRGKGDFYASSDLEDIIMSLTVVPRLWKMWPIPLANSAATSARKSEGCSTTGNLLTPCQDI